MPDLSPSDPSSPDTSAADPAGGASGFPRSPAAGLPATVSPSAGPAPRLPFGLHPDQAFVLGATLAALFVRVWLAARSEVWLDEANSVLIALTPLRDLAATLRPDSSPPLYYLVLKLWAFLTPFEPFWLRLPSIFFGCSAIPALWMVGSKMDRPLTGVVGAWLLALNPLHAYYSEEIRMYSMLVFLGLLFYFAVFHLLPRAGAVLPALLAGTALVYTHYYGLVFAGAGLLVALVVLPDRRGKVLMCGGGIGLAFLPWLPVFLTQLDNPHHLVWIAPFWADYPRAFGMLRSFQAFLPGGMKYAFVPLRGVPLQAMVAAVGLSPFVALLLKAHRKRLLSPLALPLILMGITLLILVIRSYTGTPIYLAGRSDIVVLPLFILVLAMALSRLGRWPRALFLAAWATLSAAELLESAESLRKSGNVAIAEAVESAGCRTVVATGLTYGPVLFYQMVAEDGAQVFPFPIEMGKHPGNLDPNGYTPEGLLRDARILAQKFPPGEGVCVLGTSATFSGPLAEAFLAAGATAREIGVFYPSLMRGSPYVLVTF